MVFSTYENCVISIHWWQLLEESRIHAYQGYQKLKHVYRPKLKGLVLWCLIPNFYIILPISTSLFQSHLQELNGLTVLLSNSNNFSNYRKALQDVDGRFRIPIMGIHLKNLIAWAGSGQNQDFDKCRTISERRIFQLGHLLSYFLGANRAGHTFPEPNLDLINTLKVSLDISYNEDDIYSLSLKREPRTLLNVSPSIKKV